MLAEARAAHAPSMDLVKIRELSAQLRKESDRRARLQYVNAMIGTEEMGKAGDALNYAANEIERLEKEGKIARAVIADREPLSISEREQARGQLALQRVQIEELRASLTRLDSAFARIGAAKDAEIERVAELAADYLASGNAVHAANERLRAVLANAKEAGENVCDALAKALAKGEMRGAEIERLRLALKNALAMSHSENSVGDVCSEAMSPAVGS